MNVWRGVFVRVWATAAVAVLPGCVDGFGLEPRAGDWPEAGAPEWFKYPDAASELYVRATEEWESAQEAVTEQYRAGVITGREAERIFNDSESWLKRRIAYRRLTVEVLRGPNGPAWVAELERRGGAPAEASSIPRLIGFHERGIQGLAARLADSHLVPPNLIMGDNPGTPPSGDDCAADEDECGEAADQHGSSARSAQSTVR